MPVPEKKSTTSTPDPEIFEQVGSQLPDQNTFHQHLREQIRRAVQAVMEEVMRDELTKFLGAQWGSVLPSSTATAMEATREIWRPHQAPLKICVSREIGKDTSIRKSLSAIAAMNRQWQKG